MLFDDGDSSPTLTMEKLVHVHSEVVRDPLTRYKYLALVYALKYRKGLADTSHQNIVREATWSGWNQYLLEMKKQLRPQEYSDCFRST